MSALMDAADLQSVTLRLATLVKTLAHHHSALAEILAIQEGVSAVEHEVLMEAFKASAAVVFEAGAIQEELVKLQGKATSA